ncbi:MAG TPA: hypothetical protein VFI65_06615 [Streptosporangiaceae bacterium]|nr:hypothetical protein [Streptosporangiaceae bacterium]
MSRLVILDVAAVRALGDPAHPKHRRVVSHLQIVASRKRRAEAVQVVVPTTVRVEAGWDRASAAWAFPNRLRITDVPLDQSLGNVAAAIRRISAVSAARAHVGAVIHSTSAAEISIVTSDPEDIRSIAAYRSITIVAI